MGGGIAGEFALVVSSGDHDAVVHDDRADRYVVVRKRKRGLLHGENHCSRIIGDHLAQHGGGCGI